MSPAENPQHALIFAAIICMKQATSCMNRAFTGKTNCLKNSTIYIATTGFPEPLRLRKSCFWRLRAMRFVLWLIALHIAQFGIAQQPTAASKTTQVIAAPADTMPLLFTYALAPERSMPEHDTLVDQQFRMYNPARKQLIDWGNLGNLGTPARPMLFEAMPRLGFDPGIHSYDLYREQPNDLKFYRNTRSFSEVFFSQGKTQFDGTLNARFARTFEGGTVFSLDYRSINNLGQYRYQRARHNALSVGVWVPVGERYDLFLIFTKTVMRQQENGGITTDTVFNDSQFSGPITAPIWLSDEVAKTRLNDQTLFLTQYLKLLGKGEDKRVLRASHTLSWNQLDFKFSDAPLNNDSLYYNDLFFADQRGLRQVYDVGTLENSVGLSTFKAKARGRPSDMLAVGISHRYFKIKQEPTDTAFSNFFLTGNLSITPSERFAFVAKGALGLLKNFGEYQASGDLTLGLGPVGQFRAGVLSQRYPPDLMHFRLYVSQRLVWRNDFSKPVENVLWATYRLPVAGFEATGRYQVLSNYLYYDQNGKAAQLPKGDALQVIQFVVSENLHIGGFHLDNTVAVQQANQDAVFHLPKWFSKNSLYFDGKVFHKRMQLSAGVDFRVNQEFRPDGYMPLTGQFYVQDVARQKVYPWLDAFAAFKVQTFRFFIRYENLSNFWNKEAVFYQVAGYPQPFKGIRFGISWRFLDLNKRAPDDKGTTSPGGTPSGRPPGLGGSRGF